MPLICSAASQERIERWSALDLLRPGLSRTETFSLHQSTPATRRFARPRTVPSSPAWQLMVRSRSDPTCTPSAKAGARSFIRATAASLISANGDRVGRPEFSITGSGSVADVVRYAFIVSGLSPTTPCPICAHAFPGATIVPVHYEGWAYFTQSGGGLVQSFAALGLGHRLRMLQHGVPTAIEPR